MTQVAKQAAEIRARKLREAASEDLLAACERLVALQNAQPHWHQRPGIWDDDNKEGVRGTRCHQCWSYDDARAAIAKAKGEAS